MKFVPIHVHSTCGSIADSAAKVKDIVSKAKAIGAPGCSLTDHGSMSASLKFYKECKKQGINPIIGVELYVNNNRDFKDKTNRKNHHICLYAKNFQGYKDLIWLQGEAVHHFYSKPRSTNELIFQKAKSGNLICTTACLGSEFNHLFEQGKTDEAEELILEYHNAFGKGNFFLEIQCNELPSQREYNNHLIRISKKHDIPMVLGLDAHYVEKEDHFLQQLMFLIRDKKTVNDLKEEKEDAWQFSTKTLWIKTESEIHECAKKFGYGYSKEFIDELIANTNKINDMVDIEIPFYDYKFPKHQHEKGISSKEVLLKKVGAGLKEKLASKLIAEEELPVYLERVRTEIDVLTNNKYDLSDYFLFISDVKDFVYENGGLLGAGRGSASGCLVSYLLDIVKLDPIKEGLLFERFLTKERLNVDISDIDIDVDSTTLPKIEFWLREKYGEFNVSHIASYSKFSIKNTVKDVARALDVNQDLATLNKITKSLDDGSEDLANEWTRAEKRFGKKSKEHKWLTAHRQDVLKWANKLVGCVRNTGRHASGTVISPKVLHEYVPLVRHKGEVLVAYEEGVQNRFLSMAGLAKLDLLGLSSAEIIGDTIDLIKKTNPNFPYDKKSIFFMDKEDKGILSEFAKGNTDNCFQFSSPGMKGILQNMVVDKFSDLIVCNAVYRPGSLSAGMHQEAIANKMKSKIKYIHPMLEPILKESYGVPVFQESINLIFSNIGNFNAAASEEARRSVKLLGKKIKDKEQVEKLNKLIDEFKIGARSNGLSEEQINQLLKYLEAASEYGFNKSHSAAYSLNSFIIMYLKVNHPLEFFTAVLNSVSSNEEKLHNTINEAKRNRINIENIDINKSGWEFSIIDGSIFSGFSFLKGSSKADIDKFIELRPFVSPLDFVQKALDNKISKRTLYPLIQTGVCNSVHSNAKKLIEMYERIKKQHKKKKFTWQQGEDIISEVELDEGILPYTNQELAEFELKFVGFYLQNDVLSMYKDYFKMFNAMKLSEMPIMPKETFLNKYNGDETTNYKYPVYGVITAEAIKKTKKGQEYRILTISDRGKRASSIMFKVWGHEIMKLKSLYGGIEASELFKKGTVACVKLTENSFGFSLQPLPRGIEKDDIGNFTFVNFSVLGLDV
jgi:DNA polymerase III subunit alpha